MNTYRDPKPSKTLSTPTEITDFLGNNSPRLPVKDLQSPRLPIIRSQPLQEWYTHAGGSVCVTSADSRKGFPDPNTQGWACTLPAGQQIHRRVIYFKRRRKEVILIELIFHTYQSPHIGSKLRFAKATQLTSSSRSVYQSLEVAYRQ